MDLFRRLEEEAKREGECEGSNSKLQSTEVGSPEKPKESELTQKAAVSKAPSVVVSADKTNPAVEAK